MNGLAGKLSSINHWIFDIRTILPSVPTGTLEITSYHWSSMYFHACQSVQYLTTTKVFNSEKYAAGKQL